MRNTLFALAVCTAVTAAAQDKLADGLYARFTTTKGDYLYAFDWNGKHFLIDSRLKIWTLTPYNVWRQVGAVQELLP